MTIPTGNSANSDKLPSLKKQPDDVIINTLKSLTPKERGVVAVTSKYFNQLVNNVGLDEASSLGLTLTNVKAANKEMGIFYQNQALIKALNITDKNKLNEIMSIKSPFLQRTEIDLYINNNIMLDNIGHSALQELLFKWGNGDKLTEEQNSIALGVMKSLNTTALLNLFENLAPQFQFLNHPKVCDVLMKKCIEIPDYIREYQENHRVIYVGGNIINVFVVIAEASKGKRCNLQPLLREKILKKIEEEIILRVKKSNNVLKEKASATANIGPREFFGHTIEEVTAMIQSKKCEEVLKNVQNNIEKITEIILENLKQTNEVDKKDIQAAKGDQKGEKK